MPHLLVAGTTGSGKSVGVNAMILSLLYKAEPKQVRLILVDPKMLELSVYQDIPHLLAPVVTDMKQAANALMWCVAEMERRYKLMSWVGVRNLSGFNHKVAEAEKHGVLPLDDRTWELFGGSPRPGTPHSGDEYVYWPPVSHIPADPAPPLGGRSWTIKCDVEVLEGGSEGVLYARGSQNVGHTFFIKDGKLQFDYNALGNHYRAAFDLTLTPGAHQIEARFDRHGKAGMLTLAVDGTDLGSIEIGTIVRMLGSTGLDLGRDRLSPVVSDYEGPFPFTGKLLKVTFKIRSRRDRADVRAETRTELAKE